MFTFIWDILLILYMLLTAIIMLNRGTRFSEDSVLSDFTTLLFFVFGALNGVSLLASFLLYRQKKFGFWLYLLSNVALIVSTFLLLETLQADYIPISFTFVLIGLFGTQWRRLSQDQFVFMPKKILDSS